MIPDHILELATSDPLNGILALIQFTKEQMGSHDGFDEGEYGVMLEAFALISSLRDANMIHIEVYEPDLDGNIQGSASKIWQYFSLVEEFLKSQASAHRLEDLKRKFAATLTNSFGYQFTEGDIGRIQEIVNELRSLLTKDSGLEEGHKRRLLKRLEELQKELHKKVADLDHFYGLMGDFGVAVGKLGQDAKPFTDRIRELIGFAWKAQARAEQLSSSAENPLLGHGEGEPPQLT
jgi:uncharacterized protein YoxC